MPKDDERAEDDGILLILFEQDLSGVTEMKLWKKSLKKMMMFSTCLFQLLLFKSYFSFLRLRGLQKTVDYHDLSSSNTVYEQVELFPSSFLLPNLDSVSVVLSSSDRSFYRG